MVSCKIASQFCCGCSVSFGVKLLLIMHLMNNFYFCSTIAISIIGGGTFLGSESLSRLDVETANLSKNVAISGFCLVGIPIIFMALWGVFQRVETLVRLYFWYILASFLLDLGFIIQYFVVQNPCDSLPSRFQASGQAFTCGVARIVDGTLIALLIGIQVYFIFIVWSFCEDLAENGGIDFSDLGKDWQGKQLSPADLQRKMYHQHSFAEENDSIYGTLATTSEWKTYQSGLFGFTPQQTYDYAVSSGLGGQKIFKVSDRHEMRYPPPSERASP